jgi:hypothetical protein
MKSPTKKNTRRKVVNIKAWAFVDKEGNFDRVPLFDNYPRIFFARSEDTRFVEGQKKLGLHEVELSISYSLPATPRRPKQH